MDEQAKKSALRMIPYGNYIAGARAREVSDPAEDLNAFLASWVTQCSFKPPLVVMAVRGDSRSHRMIRESGVFTLNIVGAEQKDLATALLKGADVDADAGTISGTPYTLGEETGAPILTEFPAWLECRVEETVDAGGDHTLFVARVVNAGHRENDGILTHEAAGWHYGG